MNPYQRDNREQRIPKDVPEGNSSFTQTFSACRGSRLVQARLVRLDEKSNYFKTHRKYTCQVRPVPSKANEDEELIKLLKIKENNK